MGIWFLAHNSVIFFPIDKIVQFIQFHIRVQDQEATWVLDIFRVFGHIGPGGFPEYKEIEGYELKTFFSTNPTRNVPEQ